LWCTIVDKIGVAVFDLETDSIWMTQAANCGSTPAALNNIQDLSAVTGACGVTESAVDTTSSTLIPSAPAPEQNAGAAPTGNVASQASGTGSQSRPTPSSGSSRRGWSETGLLWGLGMALLQVLFV